MHATERICAISRSDHEQGMQKMKDMVNMQWYKWTYMKFGE
jgi:hypothetical protein